MPRYVVRYGTMRNLGVFSTREQDRYARSMKVVVRTSRGLEAGEVLCEATENALSQMPSGSGGQIMREVTTADGDQMLGLEGRRRDELLACKRHVQTLNLPMELVDIEHIFGGERIVIYYLSEDRVDFRELVKTLATEFQTRIELRQIGARDEAKLLADYGDCGKPVCCNTHLSEMPPVSMKMAKLQKATLDPTKISGRCGRLKCCLRYEYDTYEELQRELPPIGSDVVTTTGRARVLGQEILTQQLLVQMEDHRRLLIAASDVLSVLKRGNQSHEPRRNERRESHSEAPPESQAASSSSATDTIVDDANDQNSPLP